MKIHESTHVPQPPREEINRALKSAAPEPSSHREVMEEHAGSAWLQLWGMAPLDAHGYDGI